MRLAIVNIFVVIRYLDKKYGKKYSVMNLSLHVKKGLRYFCMAPNSKKYSQAYTDHITSTWGNYALFLELQLTFIGQHVTQKSSSGTRRANSRITTLVAC